MSETERRYPPTTMNPPVTRFSVSVQPGDGSPHIHFERDVAEVVIPPAGTPVFVRLGYDPSFEVTSVAVEPSGWPMVYVRCRAARPSSAREAEELAQWLVGAGWKRL